MAIETPSKYGFDQMTDNPALELRLRKLERELASRSDTNLGSTESRLITGDEIPAAITGLALVSALQTIRIKWNASQINNLKEYEVQVDTDTNFPDPDIFRTTLLNYDYTGGDANTTYYVRVAAVSTGGQTGTWSGTLNTTTGQVENGDLADLSVSTGKVQIEALAVIATSTQVGTVTISSQDTFETVGTLSVTKDEGTSSDLLLDAYTIFEEVGGGASNALASYRLRRDSTVLATIGESGKGVRIGNAKELSQTISYVETGLAAGTYSYTFQATKRDSTALDVKGTVMRAQEVKQVN
jgi:hypothetical protein